MNAYEADAAPDLRDFLGRRITGGSCVIYPTKQGSNAATLLHACVIGFAHPTVYGTLQEDEWHVVAERPDDAWYSAHERDWRAKTGRAMPDRRITVRLRYPNRLFVTGETPDEFWARYTERNAPG